MTARLLLLCLFVVSLALPATVAVAQDAGPTITTQVVESFDGEPIVSTLFLPPGTSDEDPAPLVLRTHGWGGSGETEVGGTLDVLLDHEYAVLTWDQRGFGCSGGVVQIDKPEFEGRDASALIDWAVDHAPVATVDGDPVVGFTGGSYAGGIQTATSSIDPRIDAIAPEISWYDLRYSLYSGEVVNQGWAALLYGVGLATSQAEGLSPDCPGFAEHGPQEGGLDPIITQGFVEGTSGNEISGEVLDYFADSSLGHYGQEHPVALPTLVLQGSVDTLFDLGDGYRIVEHVRQQGAPARFVAFCGGHVACPASYSELDDRGFMDDAIIAWFDRYLRGDTTVDTGAPVTYRTNDGQWRDAADFPPSDFGTLEGSGEGSLVSVPVVLDTPAPNEVQAYVENLSGGGIPPLPLTTAQPANDLELAGGQAFSVPIAAAEDGPIELLGIPTVSLAMSGTGTEVILFAKLVDREAGEVVNLQEGTVRVPLDDAGDAAAAATVDVLMPGVAYTLPEGRHLDLQVSTASTMHANARLPAQVELQVSASVPADVQSAPADESIGPEPAPAPGDEDERTARPVLPATGGQVPVFLAMAALTALAHRRRRR